MIAVSPLQKVKLDDGSNYDSREEEQERHDEGPPRECEFKVKFTTEHQVGSFRHGVESTVKHRDGGGC